MTEALRFAPADRDINVIRISELVLFQALLALMEPGVGLLHSVHRFDDALADGGPDELNQGLVVEHGLAANGESAAQFGQQLHHLLGMHIEQVQMLVDWKSQRRISGPGVAHCVMLGAFSFRRDRTVPEELKRERVCPGYSLAAMFGDSHIAAFHGRWGVVRGVPVLAHRRVP